MKSFLLVAVAGILMTACGGDYCMCIGNPPATPPTVPGHGFDITVTEQDHAVTMHVGQKLELVLHAASGMKPWSHPTSSDTSVLTPIVDPAATAVRGVTLAAFQANARGQVDVTANAGPDCQANQPCPMYLAVYTLKVTITG